jgi:hypothetical protein
MRRPILGGVECIDGSTDLQATLMGAQGYAGQCAILNVCGRFNGAG